MIRPSTLIYATLASLIVWAIIVAAVTANSRQQCETVTSVETCAWELR